MEYSAFNIPKANAKVDIILPGDSNDDIEFIGCELFARDTQESWSYMSFSCWINASNAKLQFMHGGGDQDQVFELSDLKDRELIVGHIISRYPVEVKYEENGTFYEMLLMKNITIVMFSPVPVVFDEFISKIRSNIEYQKSKGNLF